MATTRFAIIIPARFASKRYPGKPLVRLAGATGIEKSLIRRSWECAMQVDGAVGTWVATDDDRIAEEVMAFGGEVVMTSPDCANGTERCAEAALRITPAADVIVNFQGDSPLSPGFVAADLVARLEDDAALAMATPAVRTSWAMYAHLVNDQAQGRVGGTTVVFDARDRALYFSKRVLPHLTEARCKADAPPPVHLHLGLYAYRRSALMAYRESEMCELERLEGLEQLRFLHLGLPVGVVRCDPLDWDVFEVNNPSDRPLVEGVLRERGIA